jgi:hypothetical protein
MPTQIIKMFQSTALLGMRDLVLTIFQCLMRVLQHKPKLIGTEDAIIPITLMIQAILNNNTEPMTLKISVYLAEAM